MHYLNIKYNTVNNAIEILDTNKMQNVKYRNIIQKKQCINAECNMYVSIYN